MSKHHKRIGVSKKMMKGFPTFSAALFSQQDEIERLRARVAELDSDCGEYAKRMEVARTVIGEQGHIIQDLEAKLAAEKEQAYLTLCRVAELEAALLQQTDNMAFMLNRCDLPSQWFDKFDRELTEDRKLLPPAPARPARRRSPMTHADLIAALRGQLIWLAAGSCSCGIKSPKAAAHDTECRYAVAMAALDNVDELAALKARGGEG